MRELPALFVTSLVVGFSGAMMPGPLLLVNVHQTARRGLVAAPLVTMGHAAAELAFTLALFLGLGPLLGAPPIITLIALVGGGVLVWMGLGMVREARFVSLINEARPGPVGWGPVGAGVTASISNPYWCIWWATVGAGYVALARPLGLPGVAAFFLGHITSDLVWLTLISFTLVSGKRVMSDRVYRLLLTGLGIFLCVLAAGILFWALRLLAA